MGTKCMLGYENDMGEIEFIYIFHKGHLEEMRPKLSLLTSKDEIVSIVQEGDRDYYDYPGELNGHPLKEIRTHSAEDLDTYEAIFLSSDDVAFCYLFTDEGSFVNERNDMGFVPILEYGKDLSEEDEEDFS